MCKITILHYVRCGCSALDGNGGNGFIVTKAWHNRILLDRDTVTHERCVQARCAELDTSESNTLEFSPCTNVQVKNICFEEEVCFRCLMHQRSKERAGKIRALLAEHRSFSARYATTKESAAKDAKSTKGMWQSIRATPQLDKAWQDETQSSTGTIGNLHATQSERNIPVKADWEVRLQNHIAKRATKEERQGVEHGKPSAANKEQDEQRKQARLACIQIRLAQANTRAVSPEMEEKDDESALSESKEKGQTRVFEEKHTQRLQSARAAQGSSRGLGPTLDVIVSEQSFLPLPGTLESSSSQIIIAHPAILPGTSRNLLGTRPTRPSAAIKIVAPDANASNGVKPYEVVEPASSQHSKTLSAKVSEYKPFRYPPPTEPRMMSAPTEPRAMKEAGCDTCGSMSRTRGKPRQYFATARGYPSLRGWRQ